MSRQKSSCSPCAGFSLVEVTLSIGVLSFALLAVVALLPTGLRTIKDSTEQAAGAAVLTALSEALRHSTSEDGSSYRFEFLGTKEFVVGNPPPGAWIYENLTLNGSEDAGSRRIVARLEILATPSSDGLQPGRAVASVAWSAQGNPSFDPTSKTWRNAMGSLTAPIQFLPAGRP